MLIDCWAGWCSPCMAKMPRLKALYERRRADGFEVIGVNFDHDRARAEELVKTIGPALGRGLRAARRTHTRALG